MDTICVLKETQSRQASKVLRGRSRIFEVCLHFRTGIGAFMPNMDRILRISRNIRIKVTGKGSEKEWRKRKGEKWESAEAD